MRQSGVIRCKKCTKDRDAKWICLLKRPPLALSVANSYRLNFTNAIKPGLILHRRPSLTDREIIVAAGRTKCCFFKRQNPFIILLTGCFDSGPRFLSDGKSLLYLGWSVGLSVGRSVFRTRDTLTKLIVLSI